MATKMTKLGVKRKELYSSPSCAPCEPASEKDYENEVVYPELDAQGKLAEQLGAEGFEVGEEFEQTVRWRVKRVRVAEENGKKDFGLTLCMVAASDVAVGEEDDEEEEDEGADSPAMKYIQGSARSAE